MTGLPSRRMLELLRKRFSRPFAGDHEAMVSGLNESDSVQPQITADFLDDDNHPLGGVLRDSTPGLHDATERHVDWEKATSFPVEHGGVTLMPLKHEPFAWIAEANLKRPQGSYVFHKRLDANDIPDLLHKIIRHNTDAWNTSGAAEDKHGLAVGVEAAKKLLAKLSPPAAPQQMARRMLVLLRKYSGNSVTGFAGQDRTTTTSASTRRAGKFESSDDKLARLSMLATKLDQAGDHRAPIVQAMLREHQQPNRRANYNRALMQQDPNREKMVGHAYAGTGPATGGKITFHPYLSPFDHKPMVYVAHTGGFGHMAAHLTADEAAEVTRRLPQSGNDEFASAENARRAIASHAGQEGIKPLSPPVAKKARRMLALLKKYALTAESIHSLAKDTSDKSRWFKEFAGTIERLEKAASQHGNKNLQEIGRMLREDVKKGDFTGLGRIAKFFEKTNSTIDGKKLSDVIGQAAAKIGHLNLKDQSHSGKAFQQQTGAAEETGDYRKRLDEPERPKRDAFAGNSALTATDFRKAKKIGADERQKYHGGVNEKHLPRFPASSLYSGAPLEKYLQQLYHSGQRAIADKYTEPPTPKGQVPTAEDAGRKKDKAMQRKEKVDQLRDHLNGFMKGDHDFDSDLVKKLIPPEHSHYGVPALGILPHPTQKDQFHHFDTPIDQLYHWDTMSHRKKLDEEVHKLLSSGTFPWERLHAAIKKTSAPEAGHHQLLDTADKNKARDPLNYLGLHRWLMDHGPVRMDQDFPAPDKLKTNFTGAIAGLVSPHVHEAYAASGHPDLARGLSHEEITNSIGRVAKTLYDKRAKGDIKDYEPEFWPEGHPNKMRRRGRAEKKALAPIETINTLRDAPHEIVADALEDHDDPRHELVRHDAKLRGMGIESPDSSHYYSRGIHATTVNTGPTILPDGTHLFTTHFTDLSNKPRVQMEWYQDRSGEATPSNTTIMSPNAARSWLGRFNHHLVSSYPKTVNDDGVHPVVAASLEAIRDGDERHGEGIDEHGMPLSMMNRQFSHPTGDAHIKAAQANYGLPEDSA